MMEILCCPVCKGDLVLDVTAEDEQEVLRGRLRCGTCAVDFPIEDGIPNLLPPGAGT